MAARRDSAIVRADCVKAIAFAAYLLALWPCVAFAADLPDVIESMRPSIVGVGSYQALRKTPNRLTGSGFVVGNGNLVMTNAHVIDGELNEERLERWVVFVGRGKNAERREAKIIAVDGFHDLAVLSFTGEALPPLKLDATDQLREGQDIGFTGFPIGGVLGLFPVTHVGIVSAIVPIAIPQHSLRDATADQLRRLREPYNIIQLDAIAYPGNSGSALFDRETGVVVGVINSVLVKRSKENALKDPSAITYAIPVKYARDLLAKANASAATPAH